MLNRAWLLALVLGGTFGCGGAAFSTAAESDDGSAGDARGPSPGGGDSGAPTSAPDVIPLADEDALVDAANDAVALDATAFDAPGDSPSIGDARDQDASDGDATPTDALEACTPLVYYLDGDGDQYGGTTTSTGCAPPDARAWVLKGGDCDDSNPDVNPGQTGYFAQGYTPTGKATLSFDYNCDGQESESGASAKAACGLSGLNCVGSGYLEATPVRHGAGVDSFCGSAQTVACGLQGLSCVAGSPQPASPIT